MPKNVVVCCDGTANEFAQDRTNVVKLFYTLVQDQGRQVCYYHPGLGTMEPAGALTTTARSVTRLLGKVIGYGLHDDIRDAYVYIMQQYEPGDRLYMFGFSRGAYTVRAVASLLRMYGLIPRGNAPLVPYAIRMLTAINKARDVGSASQQAQRVFQLAQEFRSTFAHSPCKPWLVGVWDTVSSVGWIENPLRLPYSADNPDIAHGRHAIAIHERRAFYRTNLWRPRNPPPEGGPANLKQVWFAGVHCDVGGGYPEAESGLSKFPLKWMLDEAVSLGLLADPAKADLMLGKGGQGYAPADALAEMHSSLKGAWWLVECFPKRHFSWQKGKWERRMNLGRARTIPPGSLIHKSVYDRAGKYPPELPTDCQFVT
jgi:uncharacterized protein (DUF2235 family)